jgi:hypothetical protein
MGLEEEYRHSTRGLALLFAAALVILLVAVAWYGLMKEDSGIAAEDRPEALSQP